MIFRRMKPFYRSCIYTACLFLFVLTGCATTLPVEPPLCLPQRPILEDVSVAEQLAIRAIHPDLLRRVASNDAALKSQVRTLEGIIVAHDEPLGGCD